MRSVRLWPDLQEPFLATICNQGQNEKLPKYLTTEIDNCLILIRIESEKRKVRICSRRGSGEFYVRLNALEQELKGSLLVRVHASFIINLEKIRSVRKDTITMESGKEIPVTRKYKDQFNRAFQNYCLEMRR